MNTTSRTEALHEQVQLVKDEYGKNETAELGIPGARSPRSTMKPWSDECFTCISNALTQSSHFQGSHDIKAASHEMDKYRFCLRELNKNATSHADYKSQAESDIGPEDSLAGVKDDVQHALRPLEFEVTRRCLEYWGSQQRPQRVPIEGKVGDWESVEEFRGTLASE